VRANIRDQVAHAATPWAWRSKLAVQALAVAAALLFLAGILWALFVGEPEDQSPIARALMATVVGYFLLLRPGVRSWRRWQERQPGPAR
jgi:hypothetical protein